MGIPGLNKFLQSNCSGTGIRKINWADLSGKTVVVDTSIYLHKFVELDTLLQDMYVFMNILSQNNIHPIFVFDGKPPESKNQILQKRRELRERAKNDYDALVSTSPTDVSQISQLAELKRKFTTIKTSDIIQVKELMDAFGASYLTAPGESDPVCAYLVHTGIAYACISEDMDMFALGCSVVIRNFSVTDKSATIYYTDSILEELNISMHQFREIILLSSRDAMVVDEEGSSVMPINSIWKEFKNRRRNRNYSFPDWLLKLEKITKKCHERLDVVVTENSETTTKNTVENYLEYHDILKQCTHLPNQFKMNDKVERIVESCGFIWI